MSRAEPEASGRTETTAEASQAPVLVTGASGFVGSRLVAALASAGQRVRALSRGGRLPETPCLSLAPEAAKNVEIVRGDVLDVASLDAAAAGCRQAYHLAGYAKNWAPDAGVFHQVNVEGLRCVLAAARRAGVKRVVWTSTMMTFEPSPPGSVNDESTPRTTPYFTDYERSKAAAEEVAQAAVAGGQEVVTVNPSRVYGPGPLTEGNALSRIVDQYDRGRAPVLLAGGRNVANYAFVEDVVAGLQAAMERGRPGECYLLGGPNASLAEFFRAIDRVSGRRHWQFTIRRPGAMLYALFHLQRARWFGVHPEVTPPWIRVFLADWAFSTTKAEQELGYRITPLEEGIRRTYEWILQTRQAKSRSSAGR